MKKNIDKLNSLLSEYNSDKDVFIKQKIQKLVAKMRPQGIQLNVDSLKGLNINLQ